MKPIHVLYGRDRSDRTILINMIRQGQLQENSVNARVVAQTFKRPNQVLHGHGIRQVQSPRVDAASFTHSRFGPNVHVRSRILANLNQGQRRTSLATETRNTIGNAFLDFRSGLLAVENLHLFLHFHL
jgi:hypothetical protein